MNSRVFSPKFEIDAFVVKKCIFKFRLNVCKIKVKKKQVYVIVTIIIEYASISLNFTK